MKSSEMRNGVRTSLLALTLALSGAFLLIGCEQQGPAEEAGEKIGDTVEEAGDQVEQSGETVEDALDRS